MVEAATSVNGTAHELPLPPKPVALSVNPDNIPPDLKARAQWVVWKYEWNPAKKRKDGSGAKGDWDKPPSSAHTGRHASSTDPKTWAPFDVAFGVYRKGGWDGVGYVPTPEDGLAVIDLDKCRATDGGFIQPWATRIVSEMDTYTEVSPSRTGLRVVAFARKPDRARSKKGNVEIYDGLKKDGGPGGRFLTFTGRRLDGTPAEIFARQEQLSAVYRRELSPPRVKPTDGHTSEHAGGGNHAGPTDEAIIAKVTKGASRSGASYADLWGGGLGGFPSPSEGDQSLCNRITFFVGNDRDRIDRIFRQSDRDRAKWSERADYRERTIGNALEGTTQFYDWAKARPGKKDGGTTAAAGGGEGFELGPLRLRPHNPRRTPAGKLTLAVAVLKGGKQLDEITLSNSTSGRDQAARQLRRHLDGDTPALEKIEGAIAALFVWAAARLDQGGGEEKAGPRVLEIVRRKVPEMLDFRYQTERGLWSETRRRHFTWNDFRTNIPSWLVEEVAKACPVAGADPLAFVPDIERALKVTWGDLSERIGPPAAAADLGADSAAAACFRQAMVKLWKLPKTFERVKDPQLGDVASSASLCSRVATRASDGKGRQTERPGWHEVHRAFSAWWRPHVWDDGEEGVALAMRWELTTQIGVELPGVVDQTTLTTLGERYGVLHAGKDPPSRLTGGKRLAVLAKDLTLELLENPMFGEAASDTAQGGVTQPQ